MHPTNHEVQQRPATRTSHIPTYPNHNKPAPLEPVPQPPLFVQSSVVVPVNLPEVLPAISPTTLDSSSPIFLPKRKPEDLEIPSASEFAAEFCSIHGLNSENPSNLTQAEEDCIKLATEAREEYKRFRDQELDRNASITSAAYRNGLIQSNCSLLSGRGLTNDEKYRRRLYNNRKSSQASQVYESVLRRAQLCLLRDLQKKRRKRCLRAELQRAEAEAAMWRDHAIEIERQVQMLRGSKHHSQPRLGNVQTTLPELPPIVEDEHFNQSLGNKDSLPQVADPAFCDAHAPVSHQENDVGALSSAPNVNDILGISTSIALPEVDSTDGNVSTPGISSTLSQGLANDQLISADSGWLTANTFFESRLDNARRSQSPELPFLETDLGSGDISENFCNNS